MKLSSGERLRTGLARPMLRNPPLLFWIRLPVGFLDNENERRIQQAVERLHGDITVVVIAHRFSTVSRADQVVLLNDGKVVETGIWEELIQRPNSRMRAVTEDYSGMLY